MIPVAAVLLLYVQYRVKQLPVCFFQQYSSIQPLADAVASLVYSVLCVEPTRLPCGACVVLCFCFTAATRTL